MEYSHDAEVLEIQLRRSLERIEDSKNLMIPPRTAIERSIEAIRSSGPHRVSAAHQPEPDLGVGTIRAFLADLDHAMIGSLVEELSSAYRKAVATGDDETADVVRRALTILGRHLAAHLGPRAAAVSMN